MDAEPIEAVASSAKAEPVTIRSLFLVCFQIGLTSFGGGLSGWLFREFVVRKRWVGEDEFVTSFAVAQMLPGPNAVNLIVLLTNRLRGIPGVLAAAFGFLLGPFFSVLLLYWLFNSVTNLQLVSAVSAGVAAAALGLILVICITGVRRNAASPVGLVMIAATAVPIGLLHLPLVPVVLVVAPIAVALRWWRG